MNFLKISFIFIVICNSFQLLCPPKIKLSDLDSAALSSCCFSSSAWLSEEEMCAQRLLSQSFNRLERQMRQSCFTTELEFKKFCAIVAAFKQQNQTLLQENRLLHDGDASLQDNQFDIVFVQELQNIAESQKFDKATIPAAFQPILLAGFVAMQSVAQKGNFIEPDQSSCASSALSIEGPESSLCEPVTFE